MAAKISLFSNEKSAKKETKNYEKRIRFYKSLFGGLNWREKGHQFCLFLSEEILKSCDFLLVAVLVFNTFMFMRHQ
jgi:hypothetical protein